MNSISSPSEPRRRLALREIAGYLVMAGAVFLAWEVVRTSLAERVPVAMAIRLAPNSPEVLRRAAEAELAAERFDNARALSNESLARAAFNARALRVRGLAEAKLGTDARADEMLTLAGNWSLRDDPSHAWLIEHRLKRGDYNSAFAHADTLVRRRSDIQPQLFQLFRTAAREDPRSLPVLVRLLEVSPPWRKDFLQFLSQDDVGAPIAGGLAIALQDSAAPMSASELSQLYEKWVRDRRFPGVRALRTQLGRPVSPPILQNGNFSAPGPDQVYPFGWRFGLGPGFSGNVTEDDLDQANAAYRFQYDGFGNGNLLDQMILVVPGRYRLSGRQRVETPRKDLQLEWRLFCGETGAEHVIGRLAPGEGTDWTRFRYDFSIPTNMCQTQWVRLSTLGSDKRTSLSGWLDDLAVTKVDDLRSSSAAE